MRVSDTVCRNPNKVGHSEEGGGGTYLTNRTSKFKKQPQNTFLCGIKQILTLE